MRVTETRRMRRVFRTVHAPFGEVAHARPQADRSEIGQHAAPPSPDARLVKPVPLRSHSRVWEVVPQVSRFYGIVIWMYRPDHPPPHFHAQYGEHWAQIGIAEQVVLNGSLPPRALRLVLDWALMHQAELQTNWDLAQTLKPLVAIDPLP